MGLVVPKMFLEVYYQSSCLVLLNVIQKIMLFLIDWVLFIGNHHSRVYVVYQVQSNDDDYCQSDWLQVDRGFLWIF